VIGIERLSAVIHNVYAQGKQNTLGTKSGMAKKK